MGCIFLLGNILSISRTHFLRKLHRTGRRNTLRFVRSKLLDISLDTLLTLFYFLIFRLTFPSSMVFACAILPLRVSYVTSKLVPVGVGWVCIVENAVVD